MKYNIFTIPDGSHYDCFCKYMQHFLLMTNHCYWSSALLTNVVVYIVAIGYIIVIHQADMPHKRPAHLSRPTPPADWTELGRPEAMQGRSNAGLFSRAGQVAVKSLALQQAHIAVPGPC